MVEPYYKDSLVEIWCGDCKEILPTLPEADLILTDPPYGISYVHGAINIPNATKFAGVAVAGDDRPFDPRWLLPYDNLVLWGANHYANLLPVERWFVWDKRCGVIPDRDTSDCEFAWARGTGGYCARMFRHFWDGFNKQSERGTARLHPTQKPVALMEWCLSFYPKARIVADPYMGSGTTLKAAKLLGKQAIGIEIEERYCEIAAKRCESIQAGLFDAPIVPVTREPQTGLFGETW